MAHSRRMADIDGVRPRRCTAARTHGKFRRTAEGGFVNAFGSAPGVEREQEVSAAPRTGRGHGSQSDAFRIRQAGVAAAQHEEAGSCHAVVLRSPKQRGPVAAVRAVQRGALPEEELQQVDGPGARRPVQRGAIVRIGLTQQRKGSIRSVAGATNTLDNRQLSLYSALRST